LVVPFLVVSAVKSLSFSSVVSPEDLPELLSGKELDKPKEVSGEAFKDSSERTRSKMSSSSLVLFSLLPLVVLSLVSSRISRRKTCSSKISPDQLPELPLMKVPDKPKEGSGEANQSPPTWLRLMAQRLPRARKSPWTWRP